VLQRFGENKVGKIAMGVLGMTLVACLVYSAATEERQYAAYTPSAGLAERKVEQGDIMRLEMQLAAKEVSSSSSDSRISTPRPRPRLFACRAGVDRKEVSSSSSDSRISTPRPRPRFLRAGRVMERRVMRGNVSYEQLSHCPLRCAPAFPARALHALWQVHHKMMLEATMGLSPELQAIAHKLVRTPRASMLKAIDCKKKNSYEFLLSAFRALDARISSENATLFEQDAKVSVHLCVFCRLRLCRARALALRRMSVSRVRLAKVVKALARVRSDADAGGLEDPPGALN